MKPNERDVSYLWDMLEAARNIGKFLTGVKYGTYSKNKMIQSAVERQLEIIGEAAKRVSNEFKEAHPEIPWKNIIGLRNILAHEYGEVRVDRIWLIATTSAKELTTLLKPLVPKMKAK
ncbi:MAG: DUF86 domain-containing protein [Chloroflexota bacterium]